MKVHDTCITLHIEQDGSSVGMVVTDINHLFDILNFQIREKNKELNGELYINENKSRVHRRPKANPPA